ncbi:MAG: class A beta-lactamase [Candidatus Eremiobacteraeota bacterium]|nr:class A beta-lactamase [Candidatus Eremiobacteraeota bacterium]
MKRNHFLSLAIAPLAAAPVLGALNDDFARIEQQTGGRLGIAVGDMRGAISIAHRADERFPMCSTFKLLAVAAVLSRVDERIERLERHVAYGARDLLEYAPMSRKFVKRGWMTVGELCAAAITYSDNTAANLILRTIGGPPGVTAYARRLGDTKTRLDRIEPYLNTAIPGDPRDTTTPRMMTSDIARVSLTLSWGSKVSLLAWLGGSRTGLNLLRSGFPWDWRVGDKTGMGGSHNAFGDSDTRNDVAIVEPRGQLPFIVSAYLTGVQVGAEARDRALADVARALTKITPQTPHPNSMLIPPMR